MKEGRKERGENGENRIEGRMKKVDEKGRKDDGWMKKVDETGWVILSSCFLFLLLLLLVLFCVCDDLLPNNPQSIKSFRNDLLLSRLETLSTDPHYLANCKFYIQSRLF
jgi:hypothetical protein